MLEPNSIIHPYHHGVTTILLRTIFLTTILLGKHSFRPDEATVEDLAKACLKPVIFSVYRETRSQFYLHETKLSSYICSVYCYINYTIDN